MVVLFLVELAAGQANLGGVDDDDVVARIDVGRICGLMLSPEDGCYLRREAAEYLVFRVDDVPVALNGFALCLLGFLGDSSNIFILKSAACQVGRERGCGRNPPDGTPISLPNGTGPVNPQSGEFPAFFAAMGRFYGWLSPGLGP